MENGVDWGRFAQQMASMARDLLAQESVGDTLERITTSATELVDGCDAAGILVLHGRKVETLAPTDQLVVDSDRLQEQLGEGPCFDVARHAQGRQVTASRTSPASSGAGPPTPRGPTRSGWAA